MSYRKVGILKGKIKIADDFDEPMEEFEEYATEDSIDLDAELEKGYEDMMAGRTRPAKEVFADIRKDYYG